MFRREKTPARQMAAAIAGVIAIGVATWYVYFDQTPASVETSTLLITKSLLAGQAEPHDVSRQTCNVSPEGGLTMSIKERTGAPAACCVVLDQPIDLKAHDDFSARIVSEEVENDFTIGMGTVDGRSISLTQGRLYGSKSENIFKLALDGNGHLGGKKTARVVKFCISAAGPGELQTVKVIKAELSSPALKK